MATLDQLNADIRAARTETEAAVAAAAEAWERQPGHGEGEEAWSPRQVAEHVVNVETMYTNRILEAAGYEGMERVEPSYPSTAAAIAGFAEYAALCEQRTGHLTPEDLAKPQERMGSVEAVFVARAKHLRDHAQQIREAAGIA